MGKAEVVKAPFIDKEIILLGLLAEGPAHAYAIEEKIRSRRMTEWTDIAFSSIYRVLKRLVARGLITTHIEQGGQGAARKVHVINDAGRRVLAEGVIRHLYDLTPTKSPFHVGLAFITAAPRREVIACLRGRQRTVGKVLEELHQVERQAVGMLSESPSSEAAASHQLHLRLLFGHIEHHIEAERRFLEEAMETVAGVPGRKFSSPSAKKAKRRNRS
jgi:DNA-binding PadR family transcriptional regulator